MKKNIRSVCWLLILLVMLALCIACTSTADKNGQTDHPTQAAATDISTASTTTPPAVSSEAASTAAAITDTVTDIQTPVTTETVTEAATDAVEVTAEETTDIQTETETVAEETTEEATEEATEAPDTLPAEDLSLPEGYCEVYGQTELIKGIRQNLGFAKKTDDIADKYITFTSRNTEGQILLKDGQSYTGRYIKVLYRVEAADAEESPAVSGQVLIGDKGVCQLDYQADGQWHIITVDMFEFACYGAAQTRLALRPGYVDGAKSTKVDIAWMALYPDDGAPFDENRLLDQLPSLEGTTPDLSNYQQTQDGDTYYMANIGATGGDNTYTFKDGFRMNIYHRNYFNRYTIGYSSNQPIRGEITYRIRQADGNTVTKTEVFFLEAGKNMTFSSLIDDYFDSIYAFAIDTIDMKTCNGEVATFTLECITTNIAQVYATGDYYLANDRYILGVLLSWGGGISYIEDKQDGDEKITNLINRADTGRLVQQSYYGVGNGPHYTAGTYNGTVWNYNPVQGGDLYGNASKLVDVKVSEDGQSIYIKCRPMDWAQHGSLTPSYMENTYTLCDDAILVGNRFVDFFGVKHGRRHAELPAFYTISYLGVFHYYNGTAPWTGGAYETLPNEEFWGGRNSAYHNIVAGNTETWAAWTSPDGYGIGLYVPGTEIMLAGRHVYNGSKDAKNGATSYVAPLRTMEIVSFVPFEYNYVISTGTVAEMRNTFAAYVDVIG